MMKRGLVFLASVALLVAASAPLAAATPPPLGPWTGEWKVVRIEADTGRRLPGGRLTFLQRGTVVCGMWSWNRFADGRAGTARGTATGVTMRARGKDARGFVTWTMSLRAEVVDRFIGRFTQGSTQGTMYGTRLGPPRLRPDC